MPNNLYGNTIHREINVTLAQVGAQAGQFTHFEPTFQTLVQVNLANTGTQDFIVETPKQNMIPIEGFYETVGNWFGKAGFQKDKQEDVIGLELENETEVSFNMEPISGWDFHTEGSLRNFGFEWVQKNPASIKQTKIWLDHLLTTMDKLKGSIPYSNSIRTSTHVHFDVTRYTFLDLVNFCTVYWILEEFLSHFCGQSRKGNLFCLRSKDATICQTFLSKAIRDRAPFQFHMFGNDYRYSGLNLASVKKFGSLEFRMMRGTGDKQLILDWVNILNSIRLFSLQFKTPLEVKDYFLNNVSAEELPGVIFPPDLLEKLLLSRKSDTTLAEEIRNGFVSTFQVFTSHKTFDFTEEIVKAKKKDGERKTQETERRRLDQEERLRREAAEETRYQQLVARQREVEVQRQVNPDLEDEARDTLIVQEINMVEYQGEDR